MYWRIVIDLGGELSTWGVSYRPGGKWALVCTNHLPLVFKTVFSTSCDKHLDLFTFYNGLQMVVVYNGCVCSNGGPDQTSVECCGDV